MATLSKVAVLVAVVLCEVTASPPMIGSLRPRVMLEPGTGVHVVPSADV